MWQDVNFSHGSHEEHKKRMDKVKEIRKKCDMPVAILLDTKGPEIRTGIFENVFHFCSYRSEIYPCGRQTG